MNRFLIGACFLLGSSYAVVASPPSKIVISPETLPAVARVDPRFQSYNIEMAEIVGGRFWAPYPHAGSAAEVKPSDGTGSMGFEAALFRQRAPADLANPRLRNLARALGPAYVRISDGWANKTYC